MRESAIADVIFVASQHQYVDVSQTSHEMVLLGELVREKSTNVFRKRTCFSFLCRNVLQQADKKALCHHEWSKIKMNVNIQ